MAGMMRKAAVYLGLMEDDDRYVYDQYEDEIVEEQQETAAEDEVPQQQRRSDRRTEPPGALQLRDDRRPEEYRASVSPMPDRSLDRRNSGGPVMYSVPSDRSAPDRDAYRITTLHPRTYNEARTIGEHFREGTPVIMNLTEMDDADAKRLVDFAAGLIFGLRGSIERVTQKVFLLSPANVDVTAEDKARIAEGGFFNQS
jgi:cell division inhibitor SepF